MIHSLRLAVCSHCQYRFGEQNRSRIHYIGTGCRRAPEAGSRNRLHFDSRSRLHFDSTKRLHFGSRNRLHVAGHGPRRAVVVAVTNGRLDGSTELAEVFGTW